MKTFLENLNKYWATPIFAIVGGLLAIYFSYVKQDLETQAITLKNTALKIETDLKQREFTNELKFHMYNEVKDAITKNDKKYQGAVLLIVTELLADDSLFRDKLIQLLQSSPNTSDSVKVEIKKIERKIDAFYVQQDRKADNKFTIDVFYLEEIIKESLPRAEQIKDLLERKFPNYEIRLRLLPRTINAKSGYRISANEIRYEKDEESLALECKREIESRNIFPMEKPRLREIRNNTPGYISIFVRNQ